jgi:hypothetical protein
MQHLDGYVTVHQFAALRLGKTGGNLGCHAFALLRQPILTEKSSSDDLQSMVKDFAGSQSPKDRTLML